MTNNIVYTSLKFILIELIGDILYWPMWWYTKGLKKTAFFCLNEIKAQEERLGLTIWVKNIFTPMFGQHDIEGRIISFFIRFFQIIFRAISLLVWAILMIALFLVWLILPIIIFIQLANNFMWIFS